MKRLLASLALFAAPAPAAAQEVRLPLFEAGVFGGGGLIPAYPAAGRSEARAIALPWLVYRGELLRSDERGVRGRLAQVSDLEFTLNFNGALGGGRGDGARAGMPDLDWLGEVGPSLRWTAWRSASRDTRVTLDLPVRAVFGTDFSRIRYRGFVVAPELGLERAGFPNREGRVRIGIGPVFASGLLSDYWYKVGAEHERPGRPAYDARGGYLGTRLQFSYRTPITERLFFTAGGRLESFAGARNEGGPLFRRDFNATLLAGLSVTLYRTARRAERTPDPLD